MVDPEQKYVSPTEDWTDVSWTVIQSLHSSPSEKLDVGVFLF